MDNRSVLRFAVQGKFKIYTRYFLFCQLPLKHLATAFVSQPHESERSLLHPSNVPGSYVIDV